MGGMGRSAGLGRSAPVLGREKRSEALKRKNLTCAARRIVGKDGWSLTVKRNIQMSERLAILEKARDRMIEDRDAFAKILAAPFDRDKAERARLKFIETQNLIDAIDRAIIGESRK